MFEETTSGPENHSSGFLVYQITGKRKVKMDAKDAERKAHRKYMNEKTFKELMQSLRQALEYERGKRRKGFRVTKLSSTSETKAKGQMDTD